MFVTSEPDLEIFNSLPDWMQDKIKDNLEFSGSVLETTLKGGKGEEGEPEIVKAVKAVKSNGADEGDGGNDSW